MKSITRFIPAEAIFIALLFALIYLGFAVFIEIKERECETYCAASNQTAVFISPWSPRGRRGKAHATSCECVENTE